MNGKYGTFGICNPTRSPGPTPWPRRKPATRCTTASSTPYVMTMSSSFTAGLSGTSAAAAVSSCAKSPMRSLLRGPMMAYPRGSILARAWSRSLRRDDLVAELDRPAGEDDRTKTGAMDERPQKPRPGELLEVGARLGQPAPDA